MATPEPPIPEQAASAARRAGERRSHILAAITQAPRGLGIRALAQTTGIHENTVRFHLGRLIEEGVVEKRVGASSGPGRPPLTFVARRDREGAGHDNYELIAKALSDFLDSSSPDPAAVAQEAGRHWGRRRAAGQVTPGRDEALDELTRTLDDAGFAPELKKGAAGTSVRVHHCPFLSIARRDQTVPCGVHLGLMEGLLEASDAPFEVDRLEPFVTPTMCVAHLSAAVRA
jgi:predicted ArsR family transcriptional regulator